MQPSPSNIFFAIAEALAASGKDMEAVARDMALAFAEVAKEANNGNSVEQEFRRFLCEASEVSCACPA